MKSWCLILALFFIQPLAVGQNTDSVIQIQDSSTNQVPASRIVALNSVYYELLGIGLFFGSINYERLVEISPKVYLGIRGGLGIYESIFPVAELNLAYGNIHYFETGIGTPLISPGGGGPLPMFRVGYRYQSDKGFCFRIAPQYFKLYWNDDGETKSENRIWFAMSAGYAF